MKGRPLYWLPDLMVEWLSQHPSVRHLWADAGIELHERAVDAAEAASDEERGPWLVQMPRGLH